MEELGALLALLDQLLMKAAFTAHLRVRDPQHRDRASWVQARVELQDGAPKAMVDEDLAPFPFLYARDVLEARKIGVEETIVAAAASHSSRRPTGASTGETSYPRPSGKEREASGIRILVASPMAHRDVPDDVLAHTHDLVPERGGAALEPFLGATAGDALPWMGPLVAGLFHTLAELGTQVTTSALQQEGRHSAEVQKLIDLVDQSVLHEVLAREVGLAVADPC